MYVTFSPATAAADVVAPLPVIVGLSTNVVGSSRLELAKASPAAAPCCSLRPRPGASGVVDAVLVIADGKGPDAAASTGAAGAGWKVSAAPRVGAAVPGYAVAAPGAVADGNAGTGAAAAPGSAGAAAAPGSTDVAATAGRAAAAVSELAGS